MPSYNPDQKTVLDVMLLGLAQVRAGKMFGFPAYNAGRKLAICLYENGVGMKLPEGTVRDLLEKDRHAVPFQPLGRARMREWVQINLGDPQAYRQYQAVMEESIRFVLSQQETT